MSNPASARSDSHVDSNWKIPDLLGIARILEALSSSCGLVPSLFGGQSIALNAAIKRKKIK
jgi:hypothetical protein